jgi:hypothetical protein
MAASDDFPRSTTLFDLVGGAGGMIVTFPALSGLSWVIEDIEIDLASTGTAGAALVVESDSAGGDDNIAFISVGSSSGPGAGYSRTHDVPHPLGAAVSIATQALNCEQGLTVTARAI